MDVQKIYASLLADLAAARVWYPNLLSGGGDHRARATLLHCELIEQGGLMLLRRDEIASRGVMFVYVDDLVASRAPSAARPAHSARGRQSGRVFNPRAGERS